MVCLLIAAGTSETATAQGSGPKTLPRGPVSVFKRSGVGKAFPKDARGGRIAFGDVDGDGDPDLLLSGRLLLNDGKGKFTWAKRSVGLFRGARAAIFLDYDQDGDLDVYTSGNGDGPDRLFRNDSKQGKPKFTDVSDKVGAKISDGFPGEGIGAGDLNGDGRPDIYVANYEVNFQARRDRLYLSVGKRRYRDASHLINRNHIGRGVSMIDFDRDGDMDIFVSNYRLQRNLLWVNQRKQTGSLALREEAYGRNVAGTPRGGGWGHTIGSAWGDLDNDGDYDLVSANLAHPGRYLSFSNMTQVLLQRPDHKFDVFEVGRTSGGLGIRYEESHSNPTLFDADNDGDLDLHITSVYDDSYLYRNRQSEDGKLSFRNITEPSKTRTFKSWGAATADVDGDGDLDLVVSAADRKPVLFRNQHPPRFKSVRVRLKGRRSDSWGIGATVRLQGGGALRQIRQLTIGHGTSSQSEPIVHFGVGKTKGPFKIRVQWPSGVVTHRTVKNPGALINITEQKR